MHREPNMPDRIDRDAAASTPAPVVGNTTMSEQERQALDAAGKGYDPAAGALPETGEPPAPEKPARVTRSAKKEGKDDQAKKAEHEGLVAGDTVVPSLDGRR